MVTHKCQSCGGKLIEIDHNIFECAFCGSVQSINAKNINSDISIGDLSATALENVYKSASEAMIKQKYSEAIRLFSNITGYLDADEKAVHCQKMLMESNNSEIYRSACVTMASAKTSETYKAAASIFNQILDYKDSSALMSKCLSAAELLKNEELYAQGCEMMEAQNIHFLQRAAKIFESISTFRDAQSKQKECLEIIKQQTIEIETRNSELKIKNAQASKKKKIITFAVIISIVLIIFSVIAIRKATHSVNSIKIDIVSTHSTTDDRYCYIYTDYKITNNTAVAIDYLEIITYVSDKNGKSLGTMTSSFGSSSGNRTLNLGSHESTVQEKYFSEYISNYMDSLFVSIYNNGIDNLRFKHEILYVTWTDGYTYSK